MKLSKENWKQRALYFGCGMLAMLCIQQVTATPGLFKIACIKGNQFAYGSNRIDLLFFEGKPAKCGSEDGAKETKFIKPKLAGN